MKDLEKRPRHFYPAVGFKLSCFQKMFGLLFFFFFKEVNLTSGRTLTSESLLYIRDIFVWADRHQDCNSGAILISTGEHLQ